MKWTSYLSDLPNDRIGGINKFRKEREREIPKCGVPSTKDSQKQRDRETERQL